jgi:hypothetical protein
MENIAGTEEYNLLWAALRELYEKEETRKARIRLLLEEVTELRRKTLRELGRISRLTRRLTAFQKKGMGLLLFPGEVPAAAPGKSGAPRKGAPDGAGKAPDLAPSPALPAPPEFKNRRELKAGEIQILSMIDRLKKRLLQLDLLEMRCRELLLSIRRAMDAWEHEFRYVRRRVYPLGFLSVLYKHLRSLGGKAYYSSKDVKELTVLGDLAVNIGRMAESPII